MKRRPVKYIFLPLVLMALVLTAVSSGCLNRETVSSFPKAAGLEREALKSTEPLARSKGSRFGEQAGCYHGGE